MKNKFFFAFILSLTSISFSHALQISEIQFDPKNVADSLGEWVEIYNDENVNVNISDYKLFDGDTDRAISLNNNTNTILPGEYAVVAKSASGFAGDTDNSSFTGKLYTAAIVLANTSGGQPVTRSVYLKKIIDGSQIGAISYTYVASQEGKTTQVVNGQTVKGAPTPGAINVLDTSTGASSGGGTATSTATTTTTSISTVTPAVSSNIVYVTKTYWPTSEKIYVNAGENKIVLTGAEVVFTGRALDSDKRNISSGEFNWSFGDGFTKSGSKEVKHIYHFPGEYTAIFEVSNGERVEEDRVYIKVIDSQIGISVGGDRGVNFVELTNNNNEEIKLDGLTLREIGEASSTIKSFTFPKNFSILPKRSIRVINEVTKFSDNIKELGLYYQTGKQMSGFVNPKYKQISQSASATNTVLISTSTLNVLNQNINSNNITSTSAISTATKKFIKNYVKNYTQNVKNNYEKSLVTNNLAMSPVNQSAATSTNPNKKVLINRENRGLWQKVRESFGF
jgi:PKD domain